MVIFAFRLSSPGSRVLDPDRVLDRGDSKSFEAIDVRKE